MTWHFSLSPLSVSSLFFLLMLFATCLSKKKYINLKDLLKYIIIYVNYA